MPTILFKNYAPDQAAHIPEILLEALNVYPSEIDWRVMNRFEGVSDPLPGTPLGIASVRNVNDSALVFAGDETDLYSLSNVSWVAVSRAGGYSVASDGRWEFAPFQQLVVATNGNDQMQISNAAGTLFEGLVDITLADNYTDSIVPNGGAGDPDASTFIGPIGKTIATISNFLVVGNFTDAQNGDVIDGVRWSQIGEPRKFKIDPTFQSNFIRRPDGGQVQRVVASGEYGVVFQENQISRLDLTPEVGFDVQTADQRRGALMPGGVIPHGRNIFFPSNDGFFVFNGVDSEEIGDGKIDRRFRQLYDNANQRRVTGAIDEINKLAVWSVPFNTGGEEPNRLFMYHWPSGKWSESDEAVSILISLETTGAVTDDAAFAAIDTDTGIFADLLTDSPLFRGGELRFAAFDTDRKLAFNNGPRRASLVQTSDTQLVPQGRSLVTKVRSVFDNDDGGIDAPTIQAGGRDSHQEEATFDAEAQINDDGEFPVRRENRYHQFITRTIEGGGVNHLTAVQIENDDITPTGER